jgi:hypothetical protein
MFCVDMFYEDLLICFVEPFVTVVTQFADDVNCFVMPGQTFVGWKKLIAFFAQMPLFIHFFPVFISGKIINNKKPTLTVANHKIVQQHSHATATEFLRQFKEFLLKKCIFFSSNYLAWL